MFKLIVALALLLAVFASASAPPTYSRFWCDYDSASAG